MTSTGHGRDGWDPASSVGATATMSAMVRAIATRADRSRLDDPFAEPLVRAVGIDLLSRLASGEADADGLVDQMSVDVATIRARFYDDFVLRATGAGVAQLVILASGLDSRAYRLSWPAGTVVYEVDQPGVVEFTTRTLAELGVAPTVERRAVPADLRHDWVAALLDAGYDPDRPTAWTAEGLLAYLPPEAQDRLLDTVTELSAPGSRLATDSRSTPAQGRDEATKQALHRMSERWRALGFDTDLAALRYFGARNEVAPYLTDRGWSVREHSTRDLFAAADLPLTTDVLRMSDVHYLSGVLNETTASKPRSARRDG